MLTLQHFKSKSVTTSVMPRFIRYWCNLILIISIFPHILKFKVELQNSAHYIISRKPRTSIECNLRYAYMREEIKEYFKQNMHLLWPILHLLRSSPYLSSVSLSFKKPRKARNPKKKNPPDQLPPPPPPPPPPSSSSRGGNPVPPSSSCGDFSFPENWIKPWWTI